MTDETGPVDNRDLLRRVDGSLEGMDRVLSYMESDRAGASASTTKWNGRSRNSRGRLLAERLEHIAAEMEGDDRFPEDPCGYDSPFE